MNVLYEINEMKVYVGICIYIYLFNLWFDF